MKLSELIKMYGDEDVAFQSLDNGLITMSDKGTHRELKFGTPETFHVDKTVKLGLVVWFDRDKVNQIMKSNKE